MTPKGFVDYKKREFCKDNKCPIQLELNAQKEGSPEYEAIRKRCSSGCLYTAHQFHHWTMEKGYLIQKPTPSSEE